VSQRIPKGAAEVLDAAEAQIDLAAWCRTIVPGFELAAHTKKLVDFLTALERGDFHRGIVVLPPQHGKSTLCSIALPTWILGRRPDTRIMVASYGADLAQQFGRQARDVMREHGKRMFGVEVSDESRAVDDWALARPHQGRFYSFGQDGSITGKSCEFFSIDDLFKSPEDAASEKRRQDVWDWFGGVVLARLTNRSRLLLTMSRFHQDDLIGRVEAEERRGGTRYEKLYLPMVDDSGEFSEADGPILWPERFSRELCNEKRRNNRIWQGVFQGRPTALEGNLFKREYLTRRYHLRPRCTNVVIAVDASWKAERTSDYFVAMVIGRSGPDAVVLDWVRMKADFSTGLKAIVDLKAKWPEARTTLIEGKANGPGLVTELRKRLPGVREVTPDGSKESRAHEVLPWFESRNIILPEASVMPSVVDVEDELSSFPVGAHDDLVDALVYGVRHVMRKVSGGYWDGISDGPVPSHGSGDGWQRPDHSSDSCRGTEWGDDWTGGARRI
jgi:predicted phage terminase large subunit-like protein